MGLRKAPESDVKIQWGFVYFPAPNFQQKTAPKKGPTGF